jgi:hypothetical protein
MPQASPNRLRVYAPKGVRARVSQNAPLDQNGNAMSLMMGVVSAYHLNEAAAGPFVDSIGAGPSLVAAGGITAVAGLAGTALQFDGTTGVATAADPAVLKFANTPWAFSVWIYMTANPIATIAVFSKGDGAGSYEYDLSIDPSGSARFETISNAGTGTAAGVVSSPAIPLNQWVMVTGFQDTWAGKLGIAINANPITYANITTPPVTATGAFRLGNGYGGAWFPGIVDDLTFWKRPLGNPDIFNLYNNGLGRPYPF